MLFVLASAALAGVIGHDAVDLDTVMRQTDAAVVVQLGTPAMVPVKVPVPGDDTHVCDTYDYGVWPVTVTEVVKAPVKGPSLSVGTTFDIFPANIPGLVSLTRRACLEGGSRSPIWQTFEGIEPTDGGVALVLLDWEPPYGWLESVAGSWLDPKDAKKVAKLGTPIVGSSADGDGPIFAHLLCRLDAQCTSTSVSCGLCPPCPDPQNEPMHVESARWFREQCAADRGGLELSVDCEQCGLPPLPEGPPYSRCVDMRCVGSTEPPSLE